MILFLLLSLAMTPQDQSEAAKAADQFSLDLSGTAEPADQPAAKKPATLEEQAPVGVSGTERASEEPRVEAAGAPPKVDIDPAALGGPEVISMPITLSLDTPIKDLIADRCGRAVLDADMPGLSTDANLAKFQDKSLREFQPLTGGQLTQALMAKLEADLADPSAILAAAEKKRKKEAEIGR